MNNSFLKYKVESHLSDNKDEATYVKNHLNKSFTKIDAVKSELKNLSAFEKRNSVKFESTREQLNEILDDLKWESNKSNAIILWINKNYKKLECQVAKKYKIEDLMIRAHVDKKRLVVIGKAVSNIDGLEEFVKDKSGYDVLVSIQIPG
jgi:hypothetical protein